MTVLGLDHVSVTCADLDASLAFYHGLLGIPLRERGELRGGSAGELFGDPELVARFADLDLGERRTLELLQFERPAVVPAPRMRPGEGHLCLRVDDADAVHATLAAAGCALASPQPVAIHEPGFWRGARAFYATDPDGTTVELVQWP